ncbi:hypothetical protein AB0M29_34775 [Streptomyces sp. NPDC051976]|uniref:hypothetical protein n=1 Tax=Streptomyces sp. NPDC051976 TaxID=3154947 RepID=UPI0034139B49
MTSLSGPAPDANLDAADAHALARTLASGLARDLDYDRASIRLPEPARGLDRSLDRALDRAFAHALDLDLVQKLDPARNLVRDLQVALDLDLDLALAAKLATELDNRDRSLRLTRALELERALVLDVASALTLAVAIAVSLGHAGSPMRAHDHPEDLAYVARELNRAANDFQGADLRHLGNVDLSWLNWDQHTRWTSVWTERIKNASAEQPPGSGQSTVLPALDNDTAGLPADIT